MAFNNFIAQVWDSDLLLNFREQTIAAALANRKYEGVLASGNTVHISTAVDIAIKDYKGNGRQTTPDDVDLTILDLVIDQEKSFDFLIDDIDREQAAGSMSAYTESASLGMAEDSDKFLLAQWVASAFSGTQATSITTGDDAFDVIRDLRKTLNKAFIPKASRYLLCNAEFEAILLDSSSKLTSANVAGTTDALRQGLVGGLLGFTIVTSENMPETDNPQALAIYTPAVSYVSQIEKTEAMRDVDSFSDRLRGLHVYGAKVIKPSGLAVFTAS